MQVVKVDSKVFVGKGIIHAAVFKKKDSRTIYNMIYLDGNTKEQMIKRFNVKNIEVLTIYLLNLMRVLRFYI